jgi:hypothetical protein
MSEAISETDVRDAFRRAKQKRAVFLDQHGWKPSADFPDRKTRWVKSFKGRELPMSSAGAFALEMRMA